MTKPSPKIKSKIFRQSHIALVVRLVILKAVVVILYLFVRIPKTFLLTESFSMQTISGAYAAGTIYYILLSVLEFVGVVVIVFLWHNEEYEIKNGIIFHKRGVLKIEEDSYSLKNITTLAISQSILGKFLNFGTVKIYSPIIKKEFYLSNIQDPKNVVKLIESELGVSERENIIPRRD